MVAILMVDDHLLSREFLMTLFGDCGLLEAARDVVGLKTVHAAHPDLVIADILMPHGASYEFVSQLHEGGSASSAGWMR